jgi:hypothetical protein
MAKNVAVQDNDEELEDDQVCDMMVKARELAKGFFGSETTVSAVHTLYDYLENSADPELCMADIKRWVEKAGVVHDTNKPTPEMVFGLFVRRYPDEDE